VSLEKAQVFVFYFTSKGDQGGTNPSPGSALTFIQVIIGTALSIDNLKTGSKRCK
jgi:hypothetical protein